MNRANTTIENPVTGERITFLTTSAETGGEFVVFETTLAPNGFVAAEHLHPYQSERFEILAGELEFKLDNERMVARAGEVVTIGPGIPHQFCNRGGEEVRFRTEIRPALTVETFLETMFSLASDGKTSEKGIPNPFRLAVIMDKHFDLVRLPSPPAWLQRLGIDVGAAFGRLFGYAPAHALSM